MWSQFSVERLFVAINSEENCLENLNFVSHLVLICSQSSSNNLQSSQISKFFNRPPPVDNNIPSTSNALQANLYMEKRSEEGSTSSSPPTQLEIEETPTASGDTNTKELNVPKTQCDSGGVKTKRLFEGANSIVDSKKTIKNFFVAEHDESLNDFEVPKKVARKTASTITKSTATKRSKSTKERRRKQPDIRKIMQKQNEGLALDENEELQLAMELSKAESSEQIDRPNLDQFAYKPKNGKQSLFLILKTLIDRIEFDRLQRTGDFFRSSKIVKSAKQMEIKMYAFDASRRSIAEHEKERTCRRTADGQHFDRIA